MQGVCLFAFFLSVSLLLVSVSALRDREGGHHSRKDKDTTSGGRATATGTRFAGKNVYAAIISTDPKMARIMGRDFHKVPQGVDGTPANNANKRLEHAKAMTDQLPFPVDTWWSVYTQNCPQRKTKGNDRGVMMAHYQIWQAWAAQTRNQQQTGEAAEHDNDVLVIFEDDANIAVRNVTAALHSELSAMDKDLLFLGWCYGRRGIPMCLHAYALTRKGVQALASRWDSCSNEAIDGQLKALAGESNLFSWKKAAEDSYVADLRPGFEDNPNYFTRGIFVQKNGLVSFNHHGFQNNAG